MTTHEPASASARVIGFTLGLASSIYTAFVFTKYWVWFVLPIWPSLPTLSLFHAFGLLLGTIFVGWSRALMLAERTKEKPECDTSSYVIAKPFITCLAMSLTLGFGWVATKLM